MSSSTSLRDKELVRRFLAGDESAFTEIVMLYREKVYAIAFSSIRNRADAEELAQDTFIRAHRGLARFRGDSSLATWLHRIAVNLSRNRYWYYYRRKRHLSHSIDKPFDGSDDSLADRIECPEFTPTAQVEHDELVALTARMMALLKPAHREILILRNEQHCDYDEIATRLGISVGTVKSRIARAREYLWQKIADACPAMKVS
jgi:RNA polymerase sigma-70 factor, ECF subfamily